MLVLLLLWAIVKAKRLEGELSIVKDRTEQLAQTAAIATLQLRSAEREVNDAKNREIEISNALRLATSSSDESKAELTRAINDRSIAQHRVLEIESELVREKRHFESQLTILKASVNDNETRAKESNDLLIKLSKFKSENWNKFKLL